MAAAMATDKPDVVVADIFSLGGYLSAMDVGVPLVINNPALICAIWSRCFAASGRQGST